MRHMQFFLNHAAECLCYTVTEKKKAIEQVVLGEQKYSFCCATHKQFPLMPIASTNSVQRQCLMKTDPYGHK